MSDTYSFIYFLSFCLDNEIEADDVEIVFRFSPGQEFQTLVSKVGFLVTNLRHIRRRPYSDIFIFPSTDLLSPEAEFIASLECHTIYLANDGFRNVGLCLGNRSIETVGVTFALGTSKGESTFVNLCHSPGRYIDVSVSSYVEALSALTRIRNVSKTHPLEKKIGKGDLLFFYRRGWADAIPEVVHAISRWACESNIRRVIVRGPRASGDAIDENQLVQYFLVNLSDGICVEKWADFVKPHNPNDFFSNPELVMLTSCSVSQGFVFAFEGTTTFSVPRMLPNSNLQVLELSRVLSYMKFTVNVSAPDLNSRLEQSKFVQKLGTGVTFREHNAYCRPSYMKEMNLQYAEARKTLQRRYWLLAPKARLLLRTLISLTVLRLKSSWLRSPSIRN